MAGFLIVWRVNADYHCLGALSRVGNYKVLAIAIASKKMGTEGWLGAGGASRAA